MAEHPEHEDAPPGSSATPAAAKHPTAAAAKLPLPGGGSVSGGGASGGTGGGGGGGGGDGGLIPPGGIGPNGNGGLPDLSPYPILTEEVSFPAPSPTGPGIAGGAPLGQVVESAMRQVLGWRPKAGDTKGFVAALSQSFRLTETEGHTEVTWSPRTYAAEVPAGLGAITGAQASIYSRAKVALDQSLPLLAGLQMLDVSKDPDDANAIRAIVETEMRELVGLLGTEGGPPIARVDQLFGQIGAVVGATEVESVTGHLAIVVDRFGLEPANVNTIDEEQNLTNFIVVADYFNGLRASWEAMKPYFYLVGGKPAFLGTELVLIARALEVVAESVQQVDYLMDSVWLGPAERQTIQLDFGTESMFFTDLMNLILNATQEGPQFFQDAGKDGVIAFVPTIAKLHDLAQRAMLKSPTNQGGQDPAVNKDLPPGYKVGRVQKALQELVDSLDDVYKRAKRITREPGPTISYVTYQPDPYHVGDPRPVQIFIHGNRFDTGSKVFLLPATAEAGTAPVEIQVTSARTRHIQGTVGMSDLPVGTWDVKVVNSDGGFALLEDAFTIEPPAETTPATA